MKNRAAFISVILIIILGFGVYWNSLNGKFVWDDEDLIKNNIYIKSPAYIPEIFKQDIEAGAGKRSSLYHPVQMLSYLADYSFWKSNVIGYHFTNILLHILAALALYRLITVICGNATLSLFTSILFVVHPLHAEAVTYMSGRSDPLFTLFILISFIFYVKYLDTKKIYSYVFMLVSYILALLSKEFSIIFPALLLLYHYTFKKRLDLKVFLPILCAACIYIISRMTILRYLLPGPPPMPTTVLQRMPGFSAAIANYARLLFLPFGLHMEYGNKIFSWLDPRAASGIIIILSFLFYGLKKRREDRLIFFGIGWFFLSILPVSNLYPINAYMAEHWLYLPSIGFFIILARGLAYLYNKNLNLKVFTLIFITILVTFYSYLTIRQNVYWKEPIVLYKRTLAYAPDSAGIHNNLGNVYKEMGETKEAIASYERALEIDPNLVEAYNNLGNAYSDTGKTEEAIALFKKAIEINPNYAEVYNNLGVTYIELGKNEEAISFFKEALKANPYYVISYNNIGNAYTAMRWTKMAIHAYERAIEVDPDYVLAYCNLGDSYMDIEKPQEAIELYKKAIRIDPAFITGYNSLGIAYHVTGRHNEAVSSFKDAIKIDPKDAAAYNNLGNVYITTGKNKEAVDSLDRAIEIYPDYAEAYNNLGNAYIGMRENRKAIEFYKKAIEINPDYAEAHSNLSVVYYYEKEYTLAIKYCDKAIELGYKAPSEFLELINPYRAGEEER